MAPTHSETQTIVLPNRPQDYLYDPTYTVSCRNDHIKAMAKSQSHDVQINPVFKNMFSSLHHYAPSHYHFRQQKIPEDIGLDRRTFYKGYPVVGGVAIVSSGGGGGGEGGRYSSSHFDDFNSSHHITRIIEIDSQVDGSNRYKYFRRPIIPYMPSLGGQVVFARKPVPAGVGVGQLQQQQYQQHMNNEPMTRTIAIQTMYRDSFAQTEPYSPEYIIPPTKTPPELLALATLSFGSGLPAGMAELEMIERARIKRAWEQTLPKVTDTASFEKRLKMMEEMELQEWKEREDEIKRIQEARLAILTKVIRTREAENDVLNQERIERIWQRKLQEREAMKEKIDRKRAKALRKLSEKRNKVENKFERRDIIADYANYGSKVYAPRPLDGVFMDKANATLKLQIQELEDYTGIEQLESHFPRTVFTINTSIPLNTAIKSPMERMELHMQEQLEFMDVHLKERKKKMEESLEAMQNGQPVLKFSQKIQKPPKRPPTPVIEAIPEEEEIREMHAVLLQKLIRGRVAQNMMYAGKERRLELISELRTRQSIRNAHTDFESERGSRDSLSRNRDGRSKPHTEGSVDIDGEEIEGDEDAKMHAQNEFHDPIDQDQNSLDFTYLQNQELVFDASAFKEAINKANGVAVTEQQDEATSKQLVRQNEAITKLFEANIGAEYIGKTLDFLTKELIRLREERKIAAVVMLAERTRRMREADETGRRHVELEKRRLEDDVFKQLITVHQETVESYLEDVISECIDQSSNIEAREKVREYADKINSVVDEIEKRRKAGTDESDNVVSDLVQAFLIPEVERETTREKVKQDQRKFLLAAHQAIHQKTNTIEQEAFVSSVKDSSQTK